MKIDCMIFEYDKEAYVIQIEPGQMSINFGKDGKGMPIDRRIGAFSMASPGKVVKYLYASNYDMPPTKPELSAAVEKLKPTPYED